MIARSSWLCPQPCIYVTWSPGLPAEYSLWQSGRRKSKCLDLNPALPKGSGLYWSCKTVTMTCEQNFLLGLLWSSQRADPVCNQLTIYIAHRNYLGLHNCCILLFLLMQISAPGDWVCFHFSTKRKWWLFLAQACFPGCCSSPCC